MVDTKKGNVPPVIYVAVSLGAAVWLWVELYGKRISFLETETIVSVKTWAFIPLLLLMVIWRGTVAFKLRRAERDNKDQKKNKQPTKLLKPRKRDDFIWEAIGAAVVLGFITWYSLTPIMGGISSLFEQSPWSEKFVVEAQSGIRSTGPRKYYYLGLRSLASGERFTVSIKPDRTTVLALENGYEVCAVGSKGKIGAIVDKIYLSMDRCSTNFNSSLNPDLQQGLPLRGKVTGLLARRSIVCWLSR